MGNRDVSDRLRAGEDLGTMIDEAEPLDPEPLEAEPPPFDPDDPGPVVEEGRGTPAGVWTSDRVRELPWTSPEAGWFTEAPPVRDYVLWLPDGWSGSPGGAGLLPRGKVGVLAAGGGAGKTYALCGFALALTTGKPWLNLFPVAAARKGRVAFIMGEEDAGELRRRLYNQGRAMGLAPGDMARAASGILALPGAGEADLALTMKIKDGGGPSSFAHALRDYLEAEAGAGWDAVVLDPLSRFAGPEVETDNVAATRLCQTLETLTKLPGDPTVLIAHHTTKTGRNTRDADATEVRGSSAIVDGSRWVGQLKPEKAGGLVGYSRFELSKTNYGPPLYRKPLLRADPDHCGALRVAWTEEEDAWKEAVAREAAEVAAKKAAKSGGGGGGGAQPAPKPTTGVAGLGKARV